MSYSISQISENSTKSTTFSVPEDITFPKGENEETPATDSVQPILPQSTTEREYYIYNYGASEIRLFFGGEIAMWESDLRTPFRIPPGHYSSMSGDKAKMACFGWSLGGSKITVGVFA